MSSTWEEERRHVRGLPDVLPPIPAASGASGEGGIIAKIAASRKERHEAAVEDMRQELAGISAVRPLSSFLSIEHCTLDDQMNEATYANWLVSWLICLEIESHFIISFCFSTHTHTHTHTQEVEPQVSIAGEDILSFLSDNDKLIEGFLVQIDDDQVLAEMQLEEITQVWCVFRCNWKRSLG